MSAPRKRRKPLRGLRIAVLGAGKAGSALAVDFGSAGAEVRVWSRSAARARSLVRDFGPKSGLSFAPTPIDAIAGADVVLICVADRAIGELAREIAAPSRRSKDGRKPVALHVSGFHTARPLEPLRRLGWPVGTLHPMGPLSTTWAAASLWWFAVQGDPRAVTAARKLAGKTGREVLLLRGGPRERRAYHLACSMLSNGAVSLFYAAKELVRPQGPRAAVALARLLESTAYQLVYQDTRKPLTGAVSRGDVEVVTGHIRELDRRGDRDLSQLYRLLSRRLLALADLPAPDRRAMARLLR